MKLLRSFVLLVLAGACCARADEVIVCLRHGERPRAEIGQLDVQGLNRSLALPAVLLARFGRPQFIFAPDPGADLVGGRKPGEPYYDYVRPLATIEPTAIRCGMPINTSFGFRHTDELEAELLKPTYHQALVFVCWEHLKLADFIGKFVADVRHAPLQEIRWPYEDFDSLYILRLHYGAGGPRVILEHEQEGLDGLSRNFPRPAP
ncbi:MAG TPA: hypothetical protein VFE31_09430 [Opitutaceae bacterium]|nr:hypothetical protein [Opitutaceae bacterium]